jgi:hypothetical protein
MNQAPENRNDGPSVEPNGRPNVVRQVWERPQLACLNLAAAEKGGDHVSDGADFAAS